MIKTTKKQLQFFAKLRQKKYRDEYQSYIASGLNTVETCLNENKQNGQLLIREDNILLLDDLNINDKQEIFILSAKDFIRISDEKTPQGIAMVLPLSKLDIETHPPKRDTIIYLDRINDPGNLGTIIRSALWFGFDTIFLSPESIDPFHPKVVRSGVGYTSIAHIYSNISCEILHSFASKNEYNIAITVLNGTPLKEFNSHQKTIIAFGSEAHGINSDLYKLANSKITIPKKGKGESLNLSAAASIFFYHLANNHLGI
jgi:TrmH family RNA methyltransferase